MSLSVNAVQFCQASPGVAKAMAERALALVESHSDNPYHFVGTLNNVSSILRVLDMDSEALDLLDRAAALLDGSDGDSKLYELAVYVWGNRASTAHFLKKDEVVRQSLDQLERVALQPGHRDMQGASMRWLAYQCLLRQDRQEAGLSIAEVIVGICDAHLTNPVAAQTVELLRNSLVEVAKLSHALGKKVKTQEAVNRLAFQFGIGLQGLPAPSLEASAEDPDEPVGKPVDRNFDLGTLKGAPRRVN
jgi:hypothetical protein